MSLRLVCLLTLLCCVVSAWAAPVSLRGYGAVTVTSRFSDEAGGKASWVTFTAQDAAHATIIGSKFLADLLGFGDLRVVANAGLPGTVVELPGTGRWLIGLDGAACHVLFSRSQDGLRALVTQAKGTAWQPVTARAYPRWLDCFDNDGTAIWYGGGGAVTKVPEDYQWAKDKGFALCIQPPTENRLIAPGVMDNSIVGWFQAMSKQYDVPFRALTWPKRPQWLWNRTPLPYVFPYEGYIAHPWMNYQAIASDDAFEPVATNDPYRMDFRSRFAANLKDDPNFLGYHGSTEMPSAGILQLAVVAGMPETKASWVRFLRDEMKLTLAEVGKRHRGHANAYKSWADVPVPLPTDFIGYGPDCIDLRGTWGGHADREKAGTAAKWYAEGAPDGWQPVDCNDPIILMYSYRDAAYKMDFWMRRRVTVSAAQATSLKYLHIAVSNWHGNNTPAFDVYLNGQQLKVNASWDMCYAVDGALREGVNTIVMNTHGSPVPGYIFLGATPLRAYPHMTEPENLLWYDAIEFDARLRVKSLEQSLQALRAVDPNRPLKLMANIGLLDLTTAICKRYGAYQHDTGGAGGYWAPMTGARLARLHGLPWSCEQGGPPKDAATLQKSMTFYLLYGNDAADLVFAISHYRDKPDVAAWIDQHRELMRAIGKLELPLPPVGILRSTRTNRLGFAEPWNWDTGRGTLQAVGRNFAYAEVPDIANGDIDKYQVLIDDGTLVMTDEDVAGLERFIRQGGTFIAQHHTGEHSPNKAYSWPISRLTGLRVTNNNIGTGGKIRFRADQNIWPTLRGKEINGWGLLMDYRGEDVTGDSIALAPDVKGVEVIAEWTNTKPGQGNIAVARRRIGKGQIIVLGSTFWRDSGDTKLIYQDAPAAQNVMDELLNSLGVPRDSWTGINDVWAERWQSKNGVYDLYPVARLADKGAERVNATVTLSRETPVRELVDLTALGHPRVNVTWNDGRFTLPESSFGLMESRVYAAPRADVERAALRWFEVQQRFWPALAPVKAQPLIPTPSDIVPAIEGWRITTGQTDTAWTQPTFTDTAWKPVTLGSFTAMGLPDDAVAQCRTTIAIPKAWAGQRVKLVFDAEYWFWGILPQGELWINGKLADLKQPIKPAPSSGFTVDVTEAAQTGRLTIALQVDGRLEPGKVRGRPSGVLGAFYLQSEKPSVARTPITGPWFAASDVNVFTPVEAGKSVKYTYLETRFTLPAQWPAERVFLEAPVHLGTMVLNGRVINTPGWMKALDISGLVRKDGENVLRWEPNSTWLPEAKRTNNGPVPELALVWKTR